MFSSEDAGVFPASVLPIQSGRGLWFFCFGQCQREDGFSYCLQDVQGLSCIFSQRQSGIVRDRHALDHVIPDTQANSTSRETQTLCLPPLHNCLLWLMRGTWISAWSIKDMCLYCSGSSLLFSRTSFCTADLQRNQTNVNPSVPKLRPICLTSGSHQMHPPISIHCVGSLGISFRWTVSLTT